MSSSPHLCSPHPAALALVSSSVGAIAAAERSRAATTARGTLDRSADRGAGGATRATAATGSERQTASAAAPFTKTTDAAARSASRQEPAGNTHTATKSRSRNL